MDKQRVATELVKLAEGLVGSERGRTAGLFDVLEELRDLVITRTPPRYREAAQLVKRNFNSLGALDYEKEMFKLLSELADLQDDMNEKHEAMADFWSEVRWRAHKLKTRTR